MDAAKKPSDQKSDARQNVSFSFSKRIAKHLPTYTLSNDDVSSDRELIVSVEDKKIKGLLPTEEKKKLVINPFGRNAAKIQDKNKRKAPTSSLEEMAVKELMKESAAENEKWENRDFSNLSVTIPAVLQNRILTSDKIASGTYPDSSSLEDHENVPVEEFGPAYFRGCGCNPGDPVGDTKKKHVDPVEVKIRSKGLGLGADSKLKAKSSMFESKKEEELPLVKGSYVRILEGDHEGHYGEVEGLDESRVVVRVCNVEKPISIPVLYVEVVSKKEFKKESKVINRSSYNEYKKVHESKTTSDSKETSSKDTVKKEVSVKPKDEGNVRERSPYESSKSTNDDSGYASKKKSHRRSKHSYSPDRHSPYEDKKQRLEIWLCPLLRVRFIDKQFRKGKYFNQKMIVDDVISPDSCICIAEDGKYLEDINPNSLETVIPRSESSYVKVVMGRYKGQIGSILKRDKANCIATVNFLSNREKVVKIDYDSICEYVGDVSQFE